MTEILKAYKATDKKMKCRDFQYELGNTYEHKGNIKLCGSGFHACGSEFDMLNYYPRDSRFFEVEMSGEIIKGDDKHVSSKITFKSEISFSKMFDSFFEKIKQICASSNEPNTSGDYAHSNTSGDKAHSNTSGYKAHSNTSGDEAIASSLGIFSKSMVESRDGWINIVNWIYSDKESKYIIKEICSAKPGMKIHNVEIKTNVWYWFACGEFMNSDSK